MEAFMEVFKQLPFWIQVIADLLMGLMIVATALVRIIPGDKDDQAVNKVKNWIHWALERSPTLGLNPKTKKLKDALTEVEARK